MAIGLVKWWRARFLAGYKPFSVVGGGAEASDSEELLASAASPCNSSPPPVSLLADSPPVIPSVSPTSPNDEQTNSNPTRQLSFEEFECDVSVAEGDRRRQEFSFTLYDFDGHGKITKDDIAGLVTTIYDTLGASIQVPPCGSKTIKVKLTVSPDQRTGGLAQTPKNPQNQDASCCRHMKQSCDHGNAATRRVPRRRRAPPRQRCRARRDESHSEDDAANVPPANDCKQEEIRKRVGPVPHLASSPCYNSSEGDVSDDSDVVSPSLSPLTPLVTHHRKRNGDMQRQQLLEIIQANMEKNNLSFHATRKRPQPDIRITSQSPPDEPSSPCMQREKQQTTPSATRHVSASYHKPVREANNQQTPKLNSKSRGTNARKHRQQQHNVSSAKATSQPNQTRAHVQTQLLTQNATSPANLLNNQQLLIDQGVTYANNFLNKCTDAPSVQQQQPLIGGKPSKKHLLKHATREQDQARAMAQVVRWLEREFSQNSSTNTTPASRRHVHEHIHHHYHHYHAEALV